MNKRIWLGVVLVILMTIFVANWVVLDEISYDAVKGAVFVFCSLGILAYFSWVDSEEYRKQLKKRENDRRTRPPPAH